jgi:hypothetical protein
MAKYLAITLVGALFAAGVSLAQSTPPSSNGQSGSPTSQSATQSANPAPPIAEPSMPQTQAQPPASQAQAPATGATAQAGPLRIAPGNVIPVQLTKTIDAKKAKTGDEVVAKVTMDLKNNSGDIIVPKDTAVIGRVTEVQARNKDQKESQLGIAFDQAKLKTGDMQMPMSIQAVIVLPSPNSTDSGNGAPAQAGGSATPSASPSSMGGHAGSPASAPSQQSQPATTDPIGGTNAQTSDNARPNITGKTEGVIGIPNLKLENTPQNSTQGQGALQEQGSLLSSDKNNVKLESGTLMLLRVNGSNPQAQPAPNQ